MPPLGLMYEPVSEGQLQSVNDMIPSLVLVCFDVILTCQRAYGAHGAVAVQVPRCAQVIYSVCFPFYLFDPKIVF